MIWRRSVSHKVCHYLFSSHSLLTESGTTGGRIHCNLFNLNGSCVLVGFADDPLPRQSSQTQAAEDILDKYRNIKRTSPSDGATAGASYDATGGERAPRQSHPGTCSFCTRWQTRSMNLFFVHVNRYLR